jgi:alkanesulfonate monooxygenase
MLLRIFTEPQQGATYDDQLAMARHAEALGFDAYFRSDHYLHMGGDGRPGSTDAWITLAGLARDTDRIRLGTLVSPVTFRLPGPLAISVAQVDAMSAGRVELGLGTGWFDTEHAAYGIPFPSMKERWELLEEQLEIVHGLWTTPEGDTFSFKGQHFEVVDSPARPKPVQRPHPPIVVGGVGTKRTPKLAARFADELNSSFAPPEHFATMVAAADGACEQLGRDPATLRRSFAMTVVCGKDEAEVARRAERAGSTADKVRQQLGGTPQEIVDKIGTFAAAGASTAYLQVLDFSDLEHLDLIAAEVMPAVRV